MAKKKLTACYSYHEEENEMIVIFYKFFEWMTTYLVFSSNHSVFYRNHTPCVYKYISSAQNKPFRNVVFDDLILKNVFFNLETVGSNGICNIGTEGLFHLLGIIQCQNKLNQTAFFFLKPI